MSIVEQTVLVEQSQAVCVCDGCGKAGQTHRIPAYWHEATSYGALCALCVHHFCCHGCLADWAARQAVLEESAGLEPPEEAPDAHAA